MNFDVAGTRAAERNVTVSEMVEHRKKRAVCDSRMQ